MVLRVRKPRRSLQFRALFLSSFVLLASLLFLPLLLLLVLLLYVSLLIILWFTTEIYCYIRTGKTT